MSNHVNVTKHRGPSASPVNRATTITAVPRVDGYCSVYKIEAQPMSIEDGNMSAALVADMHFQDGVPSEVGVNGITNEMLIAIMIDRLERFNAGPHRCRENSLVITKLEEALHWLEHRTTERQDRGVEGTLAL